MRSSDSKYINSTFVWKQLNEFNYKHTIILFVILKTCDSLHVKIRN